MMGIGKFGNPCVRANPGTLELIELHWDENRALIADL